MYTAAVSLPLLARRGLPTAAVALPRLTRRCLPTAAVVLPLSRRGLLVFLFFLSFLSFHVQKRRSRTRHCCCSRRLSHPERSGDRLIIQRGRETAEPSRAVGRPLNHPELTDFYRVNELFRSAIIELANSKLNEYKDYFDRYPRP